MLPLIARDAVSRRSPACISTHGTVGDRSISRRGFLGSVVAVAAAAALPAPLKGDDGPWWNPADRDVPIIVGVDLGHRDTSVTWLRFGDGPWRYVPDLNLALDRICQDAPSDVAQDLPGSEREVVVSDFGMSATRVHDPNVREARPPCLRTKHPETFGGNPA